MCWVSKCIVEKFEILLLEERINTRKIQTIYFYANNFFDAGFPGYSYIWRTCSVGISYLLTISPSASSKLKIFSRIADK